jgi:DNA-binding Lrp family transcriptional regulator
MVLSELDRRLLAALQDGLPLVPRPFAALGGRIGMAEQEVIAALARLRAHGVITRLGVIVRHHEVGYRANAMVVWDVPDERVAEAGRTLAALPFVTLCYRRPRRPPVWPYNLFCMIHGRERATVEAEIEAAAQAARLEDVRRAVLFSRRRFKQRGARYAQPLSVQEVA